MKTTHSTYHKFIRMFANILSLFAIVAIAIPVTTVAYAASQSPFLGKWQATDTDGSTMMLSIGGRSTGPFQITWTDSYFSRCSGEAGIVRGTGWLDNDPDVLNADLQLECFTTGTSLDFHTAFQYHPDANTLSIKWSYREVTIWHRPGLPPTPPAELGLRVNYGDDWVESFYEGGHTAWVTVTDSDGNLKATTELITEPKDYWGGATGFQSLDSVWFDGDGNQMESPPDVQPYDWVYGWVDNGASAQVQIGDISGMIDLEADSIGGTITAPWITDSVSVECLDWGSGSEQPFDNVPGGSILTNGSESYSCAWEEWDIQPGQTIGVGYVGPDGHWVANSFFVTNPTFVAYVPGAIEGYDWPIGNTITININDGEYTAQALSEQRPDSPEGTTRVLFELWRDNFSIKAGDQIVMTDGTITKDTVVTDLAVTDIDVSRGTVSGIYDPAYSLWVWLYGRDGQVPATDPDNGTWIATFDELPLGAWGGATQWEMDGDGTSIDFQAPNPNLYALPDENKIYAQGWIAGVQLDLKIYNPDGTEFYSDSQIVQPPSEVPWTVAVFDLGRAGFDLLPNQLIVLDQRGYERQLLVSSLRITGFDLHQHMLLGTGDPGAQIFVRINGEDLWGAVDDEGNWAISHPQLAARVWGEAIQPDGIDGDETRDGFQAPNPNLYALPDDNKIYAQEWTVGAQLDLKIYGPDGIEIYSDSQVVQPPSEVPWTVAVFDLGAAGFDLLPNQLIVLNQGGYERQLLVSSLVITGFNLTTGQVMGTGDAGAEILVRINGEDVWGNVGDDGQWAITHPRLAPGVWGEAIQPDGIDGDETRDGFQAPVE